LRHIAICGIIEIVFAEAVGARRLVSAGTELRTNASVVDFREIGFMRYGGYHTGVVNHDI
jgi:hypothetical protein